MKDNWYYVVLFEAIPATELKGNSEEELPVIEKSAMKIFPTAHPALFGAKLACNLYLSILLIRLRLLWPKVIMCLLLAIMTMLSFPSQNTWKAFIKAFIKAIPQNPGPGPQWKHPHGSKFHGTQSHLQTTNAQKKRKAAGTHLMFGWQ